MVYLGSQLSTSDTDTRSGAVNGIRSDQSNVTLDGIGVNDQNNGYAFTSVLTVPPDSVEEFRVTTANANADSGYSRGAEVALVTRSGTNALHGSAYEYNRNTVFSANDTFLKASQLANGQYVPRPHAAYAAFRLDWPGESGIRNVVIGDGMFNIDTGLNKSFNLTESKRVVLSWQTFNATNTVPYNITCARWRMCRRSVRRRHSAITPRR